MIAGPSSDAQGINLEMLLGTSCPHDSSATHGTVKYRRFPRRVPMASCQANEISLPYVQKSMALRTWEKKDLFIRCVGKSEKLERALKSP
jgi:hypothetical protein